MKNKHKDGSGNKTQVLYKREGWENWKVGHGNSLRAREVVNKCKERSWQIKTKVEVVNKRREGSDK